MPSYSRRKFLQQSSLLGAGLSVGLPAYARPSILGANDRVQVAVFGTNSRGNELASSFALAKQANVYGIGDVDTRAIAKGQATCVAAGGKKPLGAQDFRRLLDDKQVDAVVIATPDHWHAPMAMMALDAGKHVYVEKPCSHNPAEGEMLVAKQAKSGLLVQMGNQTRSSVTGRAIIQEIHQGLIGEAYAGKAWYTNTRGSIGIGKHISVPDWLDWALWQGPAPRLALKDNYVHYNWHWFWHWGTGEILNNGTHEIDLCRWALQVEFPNRVSSTGGRYHFKDDWEAYDTQLASFEFPGGKTINWEGRSCNGLPLWNRGRGAFIHGTQGSVLIDRDGYWVYDLQGKEVRHEREKGSSVSMGTAGGGSLDQLHIHNFLQGIVQNEAIHSPIADANPSVTICHLGNIAQRVGRSFYCDPTDGQPLDNYQAKTLWSRDYEPGWEPKV